MILSIIIFILVLSFLVIIHELGHYFAARWQGIRVDEFGVGYPPKAFRLFRWRGTDFTWNWIPFGGFVKMEGENGPPSAGEEQRPAADQTGDPFYSKSALARLIVIVAGATVNILFGVIAFMIVFAIIGIPSGAVVTEIVPETPAARAGVPLGSVITTVETENQRYRISDSFDLRPVLLRHLGEEVTLVTKNVCDQALCSETQRYALTLPSKDSIQPDNAEQPLTGIRPTQFMAFYPPLEQIARGVEFGLYRTYWFAVQILSTLGSMVTKLFTEGAVPKDIAGPVGIGQQVATNRLLLSWDQTLLFAAIISINLGVMNLLPIPALDGGRALFIFLEKIIGRERVNRFENPANEIGFFILIGLMILITIRDVARIILG